MKDKKNIIIVKWYTVLPLTGIVAYFLLRNEIGNWINEESLAITIFFILMSLVFIGGLVTLVLSTITHLFGPDGIKDLILAIVIGLLVLTFLYIEFHPLSKWWLIPWGIIFIPTLNVLHNRLRK